MRMKMRKFKVKVNGKEYEVEIEEIVSAPDQEKPAENVASESNESSKEGVNENSDNAEK